VFGVAGACLAMGGLAILWRFPHTTVGLALIGAAILCFGVEAAFQTRLLAGIIATVLLASGFWKLCAVESGIRPEVAFPVSAIFGATTLALLSVSKRARRNKRVV
jgi:hypothetical protein